MTPMGKVEVSGFRRKASIQAIIDSGFSGQICIPTTLAVRLGLELAGEEMIELADGSQKRVYYFRGMVRFVGKKQAVQVFLTDGKPLIGTQLLKGCQFYVDFEKETVRLGRRATKKKSSE